MLTKRREPSSQKWRTANERHHEGIQKPFSAPDQAQPIHRQLIAAAIISGAVLTVLGVMTLLENGYVQAAHETRDEFGHTHTQQATVTLPIELASPINQGEVK